MERFLIVIIFILSSYFSAIAQDSGYFFDLNITEISNRLNSAREPGAGEDDVIEISLPNHVGKYVKYQVFKSSVLSKEMEVEFPDFMTYSVRGIDNKLAYGRIFLSRFGLQGHLIIGNYRVLIDPIDKQNPLKHRAYLYENNEPFECLTKGEAQQVKGQFMGVRSPNGGTLRTYEIALVITGEFYQSTSFGNNNTAQTNAAVTNIINNINVYWNSEMSILMTIFQNVIIHTNPATDPFNPTGNNILNETGAAIHTAYSSGAYDLGHCLHASSGGGSGVAFVGVVCNNSIGTNAGRIKARGFSSGSNQNILSIGIMTHEIGHMYNSPHTFNGSLSNCAAGNHSLNNAYEIGSGTTIMSYAGICAGHNVQSTQDLYFHNKSLELFYNYVTSTSGNCSTNTSTGNTPPSVDATICGGTYTIPKLTPFELTGSGNDANGHQIVYTWEQVDEDGSNVRPTHGFIGATAGNSNLAPLFRSYPPTPLGNKRTFPSMSNVVVNAYSSNFEPLPNVSRTLNFRLIARDLVSPYAGYSYDNIAVTVDATKGPLTVTSPNTSVSLNAGSNSTVTWDVNSTNTICNTVNILLSLDGGFTYPYTLLENTINDGNQSVFLPSNLPPSTVARIKIESACLTCLKFFDISNVNFTIVSSCQIALNNICNISPLTAPANDPSLNMNLSPAFGSPFVSRQMITTGSGVLSSLHAGSTPQSGACTSLNFNDRAASFKFKPSQSGVYTFNMVGGFAHASVYSGDYTSAQPCTNFLSSTAYNSGNVSNPINISLNECETYSVVFFDASNTTGTMNITSPAGATTFLHTPVSNSNYSYTYLAVNTSSNNIVAVSATSNFTSLSPGSYCIYGLHYYSGSGNPPGNVNPASFIGQPVSSFQTSNSCARVSDNCKPVTVTSTCSAVVTNGADSGPGSLREALSCNNENTVITFAPSITQINLVSQLIVNQNMTLQGTSSTQRPEIVTSSTGIHINSGKILTLQNIDVKHNGSQTFVGNGTINIVGTTYGKQ